MKLDLRYENTVNKITLLNTSDFVTICVSTITMARQRSIFANTFLHKPLFPELSLTDVSAFHWYSTERTIASKHVQSDTLDSQQVSFRSPVIKD